jgi:soluble lytic murein transglycosylase-like protein
VRKFKLSAILGVIGLSLAQGGAGAREIEHLNFGARSGPAPEEVAVIAEDFAKAPVVPDQQAIAELMKFDFGQRSASIPAITSGDAASALPTDGLHIPLWMLPSRSVSLQRAGSAASFAYGLTGGRYDRCDGGRYAPAWWLDAKTEARRAYYFDTVAAVACEYGIPTSLLDAVIAKESAYKYWAISRKGAMGLMQIMPGTADQLGLARPFDPLSNMRAGARYLREQLDRFGRADLALAAYNAGPHRRSLREGRLPMIAETLDYVQTITTNWGRLAPRRIEISSGDRAMAAAAVVAGSRFRSVSFSQFASSALGNF